VSVGTTHGGAAGFHLPRSTALEMLRQALEERPNEACGILAGSFDAERGARAAAYHPARNAEASPYRYLVDSEDLVRIVFGIEEAGQELVGIFHSHTHTPAVPSPTDLRSAQYPDAYYLLASLTDADAPPERALRAWRIRDGESTEVPLLIE
jgi:proteasome lid subunit RPN8/RPN11